MSVLEIPRIYFKGEVSWDPVTTNNYAGCDAPAAYDENAADSLLNCQPVQSSSVANFRQTAIDEIVNSGSWNPSGSYRSPFYNSYISGVDLGNGLDTTDTFVGAPTSFTGMLTDCEPYGTYSSQLFFDDMSFGIDGGCRIYGKRVTRFTARYINMNANPSNSMIAGKASVVWQTCFDKAGLVIDPHDSAALAALAGCVAEDEDVLGVMVRFVAYRTVYYDDPTLSNGSEAAAAAGHALQAKLNAGGFQPNPARSLQVGTVGLWRRGDAMHEPGNRALLTKNVHIPKSPDLNKGTWGSAWALVGEDRITLDLSNCVPWDSRTPTKLDVGPLTLVAADPPPAVAITTVATIPASAYDQAAYEATSGIIDIPLDPGVAASLAKMDLRLVGGNGTAYLEEAPLRAIPSQPNLYIDQGDAVDTLVQVYERGVPAGAGITVTMSDLSAAPMTAITRTTDASGQVSFPLSRATATIVGLVFQPSTNLTSQGTGGAFNTQTNTYMYLRVLPADAEIGEKEPTWDNVHNYVLANWEAMAPCMDNWLRLGDEAQVRAYAPIIRQLTDPANFEGFRYMPVTRDLTVGKRQLLYNFLGGGGAFKGLAAAHAPAKVDTTDFAKLSRSMRSP